MFSIAMCVNANFDGFLARAIGEAWHGGGARCGVNNNEKALALVGARNGIMCL